ncbi:MAG: hypothetical protein K2P80_00560 [Beijerinckiaceae bacterium]|nr:hypothetical protein [Beijerinckiaceae bacterium]
MVADAPASSARTGRIDESKRQQMTESRERQVQLGQKNVSASKKAAAVFHDTTF